jgi:asparagine synthase (glutamine-hydrolysing)
MYYYLMCGIFVLIGHNSDPYVEFMKGSKRGPESSKMICVNGTYFGFHRLAINGINELSNQPMQHNNCVLICNGEIFNYKELIKQFDLDVTTDSDCEVIILLYEKIGKECIHYLDGEFAFVLYDGNDDTFFVGRDPYGVRPLYMSNDGSKYCFCSDIEPMKNLGFTQINNFTPGNTAHIDSQLHIDYFNYHTIKRITQDDHITEFYDLLCKAVHKRVVTCERPVACLLSGGLDSSLVAALSARICREKGTVLETYSIGLKNSEDLRYAAKVAAHIHSKHTEIICTEDDFYNSIPNVIKDLETYDTTTVRASVGNWNVGKYIKEHSEAKVILNGDGADELMGGYMYFHACPSSEEFDEECKRLLKNIHYFDVLRSDKSISSHGLEPRTPYLDKELVEYYLNIPIEIRNHTGLKRQEKYFIRSVINQKDPDLLPKEVLFRKKEAFSDGVSGLEKSWYEIIQDRVKDEPIVNMVDFSGMFNPPKTTEQKYYRSIFESYYPACSHLIPYFWMPKFVNATDASARTLSFYSVNVV